MQEPIHDGCSGSSLLWASAQRGVGVRRVMTPGRYPTQERIGLSAEHGAVQEAPVAAYWATLTLRWNASGDSVPGSMDRVLVHPGTVVDKPKVHG